MSYFFLDKKVAKILEQTFSNEKKLKAGQFNHRKDIAMENLLNKSIEYLLTEKQVSQLTNISIYTLRSHRFKSTGLPYIKIGKSVRYAYNDILLYIKSNKIMNQ